MPKQVKLKKRQLDQTNARKIKVSGSNTLSDEHKNWYDLPTEKVGGALQQLVARLDEINYANRDRFMRFARMYGNLEALGWAYMSSANNATQTNNFPVYNIVQSCVDTVNSKIARDNPKPYFITSGADYFDKLKAEKLTQFVQGIFQESELYDKANNKVFRDACVYGLGGLQFWLDKESNKIKCDWVFIDELKFDLFDAQKGCPRSIHRCVMLQREVLLERYPDKKDVIYRVTDATHPDYFRSRDTVVDWVVVTESWHLRNGKKPGRHTVILVDEVLLDEDYDEDWFPFAFFTYYEKPVGLYGRGITESILSGQKEINKILLFIQQCQELQASPVIIAPNEAQIAEDVMMTNNISRWIKYRSGVEPPQFMAPEACDPMIYQHLKDWMNWCYQEVGISQTAAGGTKQPGVNSAVAMRTMVDIESSRFMQVSKNWEKFFVDCADICVKLGKKAYEKDPSFSVQYVDQKSKILKEIPWKKVGMPDDMFIIRCDTVSGFPSSAAGRIQTITDFISNNFISREKGMELLQIDPDLEDEIKLQTSSLRLCEKRLSEMVEDGLYHHPTKYINVKLALTVSEATYNQLEIDECPEERLALVRIWIKELVTLTTGQDPEAMALQAVFEPPKPPPATAPIAPQPGMGAPAPVPPMIPPQQG